MLSAACRSSCRSFCRSSCRNFVAAAGTGPCHNFVAAAGTGPCHNFVAAGTGVVHIGSTTPARGTPRCTPGGRIQT